MDFPILCQKCGNKIWWNRAFIYFSYCQTAGMFYKEFNYIRTELGILTQYKSITK